MNKRTIFKPGIIFVMLFFFCCFCMQNSADTVVIKAKKIYTVSGGTITDGIIQITDGKITRVGKNVSVPRNGRLMEADVVIPGLIDIHTHLGVYSIPMVEENADGNEMTNPITPQVHALDSFNFDDPALKVGLAGGVTTIVSRPGSGNIIGGTSVAVKLKDAPPDRMVLKKICDLKMAIEGNPVGVYLNKKQMPSSLMAVYYMARKAFLDARDYQKKWDDYRKKKKKDKDAAPPKKDLGKDVLLMALNREIPVHIHCATASEIYNCIRLAGEFNLKLSLGHAYWAHLILDELKAHRDVHFNIGPPMFFNYFDNTMSFKNSPAILANAGFKVSLQTDALGGDQQNLLQLATLCVRYGMKEDDALRAVTLAEAESVGLEDRIGSIERGKDADLVFLNGEPFDFTTAVAKVMIDGRIEYENSNLPPKVFETGIPAAGGELDLPRSLEKENQNIALKGGTVYTMAGRPVENAVILIRKGKIKKVGSDIRIPGDYIVVDAGKFVVMPGLVSPRGFAGISSNWRRQSSVNEMSSPVVPQMEVKYAVEPHAPKFAFARELGITSGMVTPGNRNVMGGQGLILKMTGNVVDRMILKDKAVMVFGLGRSAKREKSMPSTRMGIASLLRETLTKAGEHMAKVEKHRKKKDQKKAPDRNLKLEALFPVLKGEMPVLIHCERRDDILTALRIADEFKLKIILDGATDAHKVIDEIRKRNIPVILNRVFRGAGNIEDRGFVPNNAILLSEAGITVAFRNNEGGRWFTPAAGSPGGDLLEIAAFHVRQGMDEEKALRAVTIDAARIIGADGSVGSIEPGKDADLLILSGHPLATRSIPEAVFIDGRLVYRRTAGSRTGSGI